MPATSPAKPVQALLRESDLDELEHQINLNNEDRRPYHGPVRSYHLYLLHEDALRAFVDSYGFGFSRIPVVPVTEWSLNRHLEKETKLPQPGQRSWESLSAGAADLLTTPKQPLSTALHFESVRDFVHAEGFGHFKDRRHVAGFRPHQFRQPPPDGGKWKVQTLELVGLVVHERPVAYVSELLPRMDVLREAPTRPLDVFETQGLEELRKGETLVVRAQGERLRMLGAIRATRQCTGCHDCDRGILLGAFSYTLSEQQN